MSSQEGMVGCGLGGTQVSELRCCVSQTQKPKYVKQGHGHLVGILCVETYVGAVGTTSVSGEPEPKLER